MVVIGSPAERDAIVIRARSPVPLTSRGTGEVVRRRSDRAPARCASRSASSAMLLAHRSPRRAPTISSRASRQRVVDAARPRRRRGRGRCARRTRGSAAAASARRRRRSRQASSWSRSDAHALQTGGTRSRTTSGYVFWAGSPSMACPTLNATGAGRRNGAGACVRLWPWKQPRSRARRRPWGRWAALGLALLFIALLDLRAGGQGHQRRDRLRAGRGPRAARARRSRSRCWSGGRSRPASSGPLGGALADGKLSISELRGTPVVLNLWASWCTPCREESPRLREGWERLGPARRRLPRAQHPGPARRRTGLQRGVRPDLSERARRAPRRGRRLRGDRDPGDLLRGRPRPGGRPRDRGRVRSRSSRRGSGPRSRARSRGRSRAVAASTCARAVRSVLGALRALADESRLMGVSLQSVRAKARCVVSK